MRSRASFSILRRFMAAICENLGIFASVICYVLVDDWHLAQIILVFWFCYCIKSMMKKSAIESFVLDIEQIYGGDVRKSWHFRFRNLLRIR